MYPKYWSTLSLTWSSFSSSCILWLRSLNSKQRFLSSVVSSWTQVWDWANIDSCACSLMHRNKDQLKIKKTTTNTDTILLHKAAYLFWLSDSCCIILLWWWWTEERTNELFIQHQNKISTYYKQIQTFSALSSCSSLSMDCLNAAFRSSLINTRQHKFYILYAIRNR